MCAVCSPSSSLSLSLSTWFMRVLLVVEQQLLQLPHTSDKMFRKICNNAGPCPVGRASVYVSPPFLIPAVNTDLPQSVVHMVVRMRVQGSAECVWQCEGERNAAALTHWSFCSFWLCCWRHIGAKKTLWLETPSTFDPLPPACVDLKWTALCWMKRQSLKHLVWFMCSALVSSSLHFCRPLMNAPIMNVHFLTGNCERRACFLVFDLCQSQALLPQSLVSSRAPVVLLILPLQTTSMRPVRPRSLDQGGRPPLICLGVRPFDYRL